MGFFVLVWKWNAFAAAADFVIKLYIQNGFKSSYDMRAFCCLWMMTGLLCFMCVCETSPLLERILHLNKKIVLAVYSHL